MRRVLIAGVQPPISKWDRVSLRLMRNVGRPTWLGELAVWIGFSLAQTLQVLERMRDRGLVKRLNGEKELWQPCKWAHDCDSLEP